MRPLSDFAHQCLIRVSDKVGHLYRNWIYSSHNCPSSVDGIADKCNCDICKEKRKELDGK